MVQVRNRANTWQYLMRYYVSSASACADPGIFTKWGGGVEGPGPPDSKKLGQRFLLFLLFFSPHLQLITYLIVLQRGPIPGSDGLFFGKQ